MWRDALAQGSFSTKSSPQIHYHQSNLPYIAKKIDRFSRVFPKLLNSGDLGCLTESHVYSSVAKATVDKGEYEEPSPAPVSMTIVWPLEVFQATRERLFCIWVWSILPSNKLDTEMSSSRSSQCKPTPPPLII